MRPGHRHCRHGAARAASRFLSVRALLRQASEEVQRPLAMELKPIPRIPARDFRASRWGRQPRIVTDNVSSWRALRIWDAEYLKAAAGACKVAVREVTGAPQNVYQNMTAGGHIAFADYLDWVLEIAGSQDIRRIAATSGNLAQLTRAIADSGFETSYYSYCVISLGATSAKRTSMESLGNESSNAPA